MGRAESRAAAAAFESESKSAVEFCCALALETSVASRARRQIGRNRWKEFATALPGNLGLSAIVTHGFCSAAVGDMAQSCYRDSTHDDSVPAILEAKISAKRSACRGGIKRESTIARVDRNFRRTADI